ncbi:MAG: RNA polymerase sigma factor [Planctomycetota bacterium]
MEAQTRAMDVSALLKESDWIGGLAAQLIGDAHAAEDLAQDTRLAALRAGTLGSPDHDRSLRPWLATVARNGARMLRRSEGSRKAREADRAKMDVSEARSPEELIGDLETQELVLRLVRDLPDELSYVILASFVEDRSPAEIAALRGIPAGTVRWRKKEALRRLRERLETHFDGDRSAWLGALLPLAQASLRKEAGAAAAKVAGFAGPLATLWITMSFTWKCTALAAAAAAVYLSALRPLASADAGESPAPSAEPRLATAPETASDDPELAVSLPGPSAFESRRATRAKIVPPEARGELLYPAPQVTRITISVTDASGRGVAGATLRPSFSAELEEAHQHVLMGLSPVEQAALMAGLVRITDAAGNATWETDLLESEGVITFLAQGPGESTGSVGLLVRPGDLGLSARIELKSAASIAGRVVHTDGSQPGRQMIFVLAEDASLLTPGTSAFEWIGHDDVVASAHTDPNGQFTVTDVPDGTWIVMTSALSGHEPVRSDGIEIIGGGRVDGVELAVEPSPLGRPQVLVLDSEGRPLETARVELKGPDGLRFEGDVNRRGVYGLAATYDRFAGGTLRVTDRSLMHEPLTLSPIPEGARTIEVRMRPVPGVVKRTFVLQTAAGRPITDHRVTITAGEASQVVAGDGASWTVELPGGSSTVSLRIFSRGFEVLVMEDLKPADLETSTEIALTPLPGISGIVLANGEPIEQARVRLHAKWPREQFNVDGNGVTRVGSELDECRTDAQGRFQLFTPEVADCVVFVKSRSLVEGVLDLGTVDPVHALDGLEVVLGAGGRLEGRCTDPERAPLGNQCLVLSHPLHSPLRARSRADGTYSFPRVPPGDWFLRSVDAFESRQMIRLVEVPPAWSYPINCQVTGGETSTLDLVVEPRMDTSVAGAWVVQTDSSAAPWSVTISQADPFVGTSDPFVEAHEAKAKVSAEDGAFFLPATSQADAVVVIQSDAIDGFIRRTVRREEFPLTVDETMATGFLRFRLGAEPNALARRAHITWRRGAWSFDCYVALPEGDSGEVEEVSVPAGLLDVSWLDQKGTVTHQQSVHLAVDATVVLQN